jgi:ADP-ribose pyrophosphatase
MSETLYHIVSRRLMCANTRFDVFFDAVQYQDGRLSEDILVIRPKIQARDMTVGVCILPEVNGQIGLMRSYRHHLGREVWQAPAGFVEDGEEPVQTAKRELEEETMLTCSSERMQTLGSFFPDAALIQGCVALFVARDAAPYNNGAKRPAEIGTGKLELFSIAALSDLVESTDAIGGSTLAACFRYLQLLGR